MRAACPSAHKSLSGVLGPKYLVGVIRWMYLCAPPLNEMMLRLVMSLIFVIMSLYGAI